MTHVLQKLQGLTVGLIDAAVNFRINVTINTEQILEAVVVVIEEKGTPAQPADGRLATTRRIRHVGEEVTAIVVIEGVIVVCECRDEQIYQTVVIVIAARHSHAGVFLAVGIIGHACGYRDFLECAVAPVVVEVVGIGVIRDEDVGKPVVIEVVEDDGEPEIEATVHDPGLG